MGIFDATKLRPFASQYPGRNQNFIQTLDYNSDTGMYEINFSPHTGYNTYAQAPTWQMGGAASPHGSGCPEGQVMGADGVCRIDPNYTGQPTFPDTTTPPDTPPDTPPHYYVKSQNYHHKCTKIIIIMYEFS